MTTILSMYNMWHVERMTIAPFIAHIEIDLFCLQLTRLVYLGDMPQL